MKQRNVVKIITVAAVFMLMALAVGCSSGGPSNVEVEKLVRAAIQADMGIDDNNPLRKIVNFNVLDGEMKGSHYTATVAYDIQFKMSFEQFREAVTAEAMQYKRNTERLPYAKMISEFKEAYGEFKKDGLAHQEVEITFAKTDAGWVITRNVE